jgi:hypothetical protein
MTGDEFERRIRKWGADVGCRSSSMPDTVKAVMSLYFGDRFTTLKDRRKEIGPGLLKAMLDQLGLTRQDLGN